MQRTLIALGCLATLVVGASADPVTLSRASLAKEARFTVTYTLAPKEGKPQVTKFAVAVSGAHARADYPVQGLGDTRYLVNSEGVFFFIPANKAAQQMPGGKGIDDALKLAFSEAVQQLRGAKKVGVAKVSGQPVDIYKNPKTGTTVCLGTAPGFKLPVKMELSNEGGKRTILVSGIQLGTPIPANYFQLPKGTQVIKSTGASGAGPGLPGIK